MKMMSYAKAKMGRFLRTKRSLMMVVRRHLRARARKFEKLVGEEIPALRELSAKGDVDAVTGGVGKADKKVEDIETGMSKDEESVTVAEGRVLKELIDVIKWFKEDHDSDAFKSFARKHPDQAAELQRFFQEESGALHELLKEAREALKSQWNQVESAVKGDKRELQGLVVSVNEQMKLHDTVWDERGYTSQTQHDEEALEDELKAFLKEMKDDHPKEVTKKVEQIKEETKHLREHFKEMMEGFVVILKMMVFLWFHYMDEGEEKLEEFLQELERSGFPRTELEALRTEMATMKQHIHESAVESRDALTRMSRTILGDIPDF